MNPALPIMNRLQIASPCSADWNEMRGDDRRRHCDACNKFVYNLPSLSPDELVDLIEKTEGKFCGRLYARDDGTVLTDDCPVGRARRLARARRRGIGVAATAAALMIGASAALFGAGWGGCEVHEIPPAGGISIVEPVPVPPPPEPMLLGDIAIDPEPEPEPEVTPDPEPQPPPNEVLGRVGFVRPEGR